MAPLSDDAVRQRYGLAPDAAVRRVRSADGRVTASPDSFTVAELDSALEWGAWGRPVVVAGGTVTLAVRGTFVGEGAPVEVTLRDARNRVVGRGTGAMHRDRAEVEVIVDRQAASREPDGVLAAADVEVRDLGLKLVSAPLLVLPFAELTDARWDVAEAREGDDVELACRVTGSRAGVERLSRYTAEIEVIRGDEGEDAVFEPVVTLRAPVVDGRIAVRWRVGFDAEGRVALATQADYDAEAERTGAEAARYARPAWRFRVRLAGLAAESSEMGYRDYIEFAFTDASGDPYDKLDVVIEHPDGSRTEHTAGPDGIVRVEPAPAGPYVIAEITEPPPESAPDK